METRNITYNGKEYKVTKGNLSDDYIDIYVKDGYDEECDPYTWIKDKDFYTWIKDKDCMVGMCLADYTDDELIELIKKIL